MAIVQTLPVPLEPTAEAAAIQLPRPGSTRSPTMGSVSSLISGRPCHERPARPSELGPGWSGALVPPTRHRGAPGPGFFRQQDGLLRAGHGTQEPRGPGMPSKKPCGAGAGVGGASSGYAYVNEDFRGDSPPSPCSDPEDVREQRARSAHLRGPPPKLIPVSGRLEKNVEKMLIRPTAFKPVMPKSRGGLSLSGFLGPRVAGPGGPGLSGSQGSLTQLFGGPVSSVSSASSSSASDKPPSLSGRGSRSPSGTLSDSGRNSLSSLPTCSTGAEPATGSPGGPFVPDAPVAGGLPGPVGAGYRGVPHSDSGRSSSSKSTGSLGGRAGGGARASSDSGSCGELSPPPGPPPAPDPEEVLLLGTLEEKLREREAELRLLRDSLDENEAAACQLYEEKQRRWAREQEELREGCAQHVRQAAQKTQHAQQVLQLQVFQLQQEKRQLQDDFAQLLQEREQLERRCASFEREQSELAPRLEETKWEVCQKSGEISLLKQQLKESQAELAQRGGELVELRAQLRAARAELRSSEGRVRGLQEAARTKAQELEVCANELQRKKNEAALLREKAGQLDLEVAGLRGGGPAGVPDPADPFLLAESDEVKAQRAAAAGGVAELRAQVERLRAELWRERRRGEEQRGGFEGERLAWQGEKEQVIRYQKQLQHNYVQMFRRNRQLEQELRRLSLELEARELADCGLVDPPAPCIQLEEITATEI
ncbi:leucine zipper putative tumor suppressor 2 [Ornithorhynchus anatinus]|uniref:Leucine zipper putative tumor suppressor 2 n=1 Tax=Ornithorhynchus anatinus TaxID=9258 RepID=A0A6I8P3X8_ORNAN|nr:leucine zipper putative tumor suppressor 2 [Ornithorhynchus anatinus]XP_028936411.1 leucine zipper putative tumor suppressor 2 [Ornithorhynchus anatinus]